MSLLLLFPDENDGSHQISPVGGASQAAAGSFSVNGTIAPAGGASLAAAGVFSINGTIAFAGAPSQAAAGVPEVRAAIALVGAPSAAAAGAFSINGTLAFVGAPSVAAAGQFGINGTIAFVGAPSTAAAGRPTVGEEDHGEQPAPAEQPSYGGHQVVYAPLGPWLVQDSHTIRPKGGASSAAAGRPRVIHGRTQARRRREEMDLMRLAA